MTEQGQVRGTRRLGGLFVLLLTALAVATASYVVNAGFAAEVNGVRDSALAVFH